MRTLLAVCLCSRQGMIEVKYFRWSIYFASLLFFVASVAVHAFPSLYPAAWVLGPGPEKLSQGLLMIASVLLLWSVMNLAFCRVRIHVS